MSIPSKSGKGWPLPPYHCVDCGADITSACRRPGKQRPPKRCAPCQRENARAKRKSRNWDKGKPPRDPICVDCGAPTKNSRTLRCDVCGPVHNKELIRQHGRTRIGWVENPTCGTCGVVIPRTKQRARSKCDACIRESARLKAKRPEVVEATRQRRKARKRLTFLILRQRSRCAICHQPFDADAFLANANTIAVDHRVPVLKGGGNELANLQAVHRECNAVKGAKDETFNLGG